MRFKILLMLGYCLVFAGCENFPINSDEKIVAPESFYSPKLIFYPRSDDFIADPPLEISLPEDKALRFQSWMRSNQFGWTPFKKSGDRFLADWCFTAWESKTSAFYLCQQEGKITYLGKGQNLAYKSPLGNAKEILDVVAEYERN